MSDARISTIDRVICRLLVALIALGAGWVLRPLTFPTALEREIHAAAWSLAGHEYDAAWRAANRALDQQPGSPSALLLAGFAAKGRFDDQSADSFLERVPPESPQYHQAELGRAHRLLLTGQVDRSEQLYRKILSRDPGHLEANRRLGFLLQSEGRLWESQDCLAQLVYQGMFSGDELLGIASTERGFLNDPGIERTLLEEIPGDSLIRLGEVRHELGRGREQDIEPVLREIVGRFPHVAEAQAQLGRLIVESGTRREFLEWNAGLAPAADKHPEIWYVRGLFARRDRLLPQATRCFGEALLRSPNHNAAHHQISGCLGLLGKTDLAKCFAQRAHVLSRLDSEMNLISHVPQAETAERVIRLLHELGRHWEAAGWAMLSSRFGLPPVHWRELYFAEARQVRQAEGLTAYASQPLRQLDLSRFPLPVWRRDADFEKSTTPGRGGAPAHAAWRFADHARDLGIDFTYFEGSTSETRLQHIFQAIGGGVGILDFNRDGRSDVYLTQANDWRRPVSESTTSDRLFLNAGDDRFEDVTARAGLGDTGFSYGVTVGDYDNDGWPDIYVGNLGPNRLYHNNGDGTFTDVSETSGTRGDSWTTSCAFADLNGDGLADLFVANYSDREFAIQNPCFIKGIETSCSPDRLPGALPQCYINLGNGRFADVSRKSGIHLAAGKGLGLVVADFHGAGRLDVFVGNDSSGNFYFKNLGPDADGIPRFLEQGGISGVAFDVDGKAQACMGIAAGDPNGDGRLDLATTNFMLEGSTLFLQQADGAFIDSTRRSGLRQPTFKMLGFGAQFIDANNDGWEDLVVTNGHVSPPQALGGGSDSDRMLPQLFANCADGTFVEALSENLGPFFQIKSLGRGLAVLDWNRDGRQDFCVSSIHGPVALVTNLTSGPLHRLVVRLVGTRAGRDAYGAVGTVTLGNRRLTRHLSAGSGFQAANEAFLWFGLGPTETVDELVITWPGGVRQRWQNLPADREILVIEGRPDPVVLVDWSNQSGAALTRPKPDVGLTAEKSLPAD